MCGIAGVCSLGCNEPISLDSLMRMIGIVKHRGPDQKGIYIDDKVGLAHARLSIIDLSSGVQPICNEDKSLWIIYNGEVFNYRELADELTKLGHKFYTTSDTEVVLHMFEEYGTECLNRLNGQFAFAIWDAKNQKLFAARDRVGIRPFYYCVSGGNFYFSSEIKSLFQVEQISRKFNPKAIDQIFTFWTTMPGETVFKGIKELKPGHFMQIENGKASIQKYWEIPYAEDAETLNTPVEQITEQAQELLYDAVKLRMRADVPVASYLSGGLDSSGLSSLVMNNFNRDLKTFGIRFGEDDYDEGIHQKKMVSYLRTDHRQIKATNEKIAAALADTLWHGEKPILRTSPIPLYLLSGLVRQNGIKVVLTGEGADEVFGGYNIFRETKFRRFWSKQLQSQKRASLIGSLYPYIFRNPQLKHTLESFFAAGLDNTDDPLFSHYLRWTNTVRTKIFFSDEMKQKLGDYDCIDQLKNSLPDNYHRRDYLSKAQYLEMSLFMSNYLLSSQGDRVAMANSVEIRLPYLDYRLIDFMARVPRKWKIFGVNEKYLLKKMFKDILPESITARSKHPYRAPIVPSLLSGRAGQQTKEMLSKSELNKANLFNGDKVERLIKKVETNGNAGEIESMAIVGILSTQILQRQFIDDFKIEDTLPEIDLLVDRRQAAKQDPVSKDQNTLAAK